MKTNFSDILQKQLDKINKRQQESLKALQEAKARAEPRQDEQDLNDNQINIMDMIK